MRVQGVDENGLLDPSPIAREPRNAYHVRMGLGPEPPASQVEIAKRWLGLHAHKRKTRNSHAHSYSLKHWAEQWGDSYVCNGALIRSAMDLGYTAWSANTTGSPNAVFNMGFHRCCETCRAFVRGFVRGQV